MMLLREIELEEADRLRGKSDEMTSPLRNGGGKKVKVPICHASSTERWCKRSATAWKLPALAQCLRNCGSHGKQLHRSFTSDLSYRKSTKSILILYCG